MFIRLMIVIAVVVISATLLLVALPSFLGPDDLADCDKKPGAVAGCQKVDAIIAISGGDTSARVKEAVKLYNNGWAPLLIFSGAAKDKTGPSNALAMQRQAVKLGVSEKDILLERFATDTAENAKNTANIIKKHKLNRVILVTSAYHQRRASLEFNAKLGEAVKIINHPVLHDKQWTEQWYLTPQGWKLAVSEFFKIMFFSFTNDKS